MAGGDPVDVHVWRDLYGSRHPMPARSTVLVLSGLGAPADHALLADKLVLAARLAEMGISVPDVMAVFPQGALPDPDSVAGAEGQADLFVKPRRGAGSRDAFALRKDDDGWSVDGISVEPGALADRLMGLSEGDDLLVQGRLVTTESLVDLACDHRAPVLRLTTSRGADGMPDLHSAMMILPRPGRNARSFLTGQIYAPVDPQTGKLVGGLILAAPDTVLDDREPGGPKIAGRAVPDFAESVRAAVKAMAVVPSLPVVHWDIILTASGPVILEGNSAGNWIVATLPGRYGLEREPLSAALGRVSR